MTTGPITALPSNRTIWLSKYIARGKFGKLETEQLGATNAMHQTQILESLRASTLHPRAHTSILNAAMVDQLFTRGGGTVASAKLVG